MFGARNPLVNWCEVLHSTAGFGAISVILYTRYIINIMVSAIFGAYSSVFVSWEHLVNG